MRRKNQKQKSGQKTRHILARKGQERSTGARKQRVRRGHVPALESRV